MWRRTIICLAYSLRKTTTSALAWSVYSSLSYIIPTYLHTFDDYLSSFLTNLKHYILYRNDSVCDFWVKILMTQCLTNITKMVSTAVKKAFSTYKTRLLKNSLSLQMLTLSCVHRKFQYLSGITGSIPPPTHYIVLDKTNKCQ